MSFFFGKIWVNIIFFGGYVQSIWMLIFVVFDALLDILILLALISLLLLVLSFDLAKFLLEFHKLLILLSQRFFGSLEILGDILLRLHFLLN